MCRFIISWVVPEAGIYSILTIKPATATYMAFNASLQTNS